MVVQVYLAVKVEAGVVERLLQAELVIHLMVLEAQEEGQVLQTILMVQQVNLVVEVDIMLVEVIHRKSVIQINL